jgi:hypothetical protein
MIRYLIVVVMFQAVWFVLGELFAGKLLLKSILFSNTERIIEFISFQLFVFFPISFGAFLLLAPSKGRRRWSIILWILAFLLICLPLFSMNNYRGGQVFNYSVVRDSLFYHLYYLYLCTAVLLVAFGFDWLGARFYCLEVEGHKRKDPPGFHSIQRVSFWRDS